MPEENLSPQERLFKVAQQQPKKTTVVPPAAAPIGKGASPSVKSIFTKVRQIFSKQKEEAKSPATQNGKPLFASGAAQSVDALKQLILAGVDLNIINRGLVLILVGLALTAVYYAVNKKPDVDKLMASVSRIKFEALQSQPIEQFKELGYYLDRFKTRDIFNATAKVAPPVVVEEAPKPPPPPPPPKLKDLVRGFKVVGIAWGDVPTAMISDSATHNVFFLKQGDIIEGTQITIKKISRDKVTVASGEEELDL